LKIRGAIGCRSWVSCLGLQDRVGVPKNRNTREDNKTIKNRQVPEDWENKSTMHLQKDLDARLTKKQDHFTLALFAYTA
jgi:hypothetical protein